MGLWNLFGSAVLAGLNSANTSSNEPDGVYSMRSSAAVFGLPYQFMPHVDLRVLDERISDNNEDFESFDSASDTSDILGSIENIGATYADKIYTKMPLLMLTPGKASFLSELKNEDRAAALQSLLTNDSKSFEGIANSTVERYYTFDADMSEYFQYVNSMCRVAAVYLGIGDKEMYYPSLNQNNEITKAKLKEFNWDVFSGYNSGGGLLERFISSVTSAIDNEQDYVTFYIEAQDSINDSFSNTTSQSSLASTINGVSSTAREMAFLAGFGSSAVGGGVKDAYEGIEDITKQLLEDLSNLGQDGGIINNIANHVTTIAQGGRMIFPEIWSDSSYGKSYNVTVKLVAPDHDKLSVYMNVIVPIIHLMAFVLPRSANGNPNTYFEPFLVRAIYKGNFAIDTGIITDLSVKRGGSDTWTLDGIPCEAEVSIGIKDLYQAISMSKTSGAQSSILANTNLMDFLGNMCGIDIYTPDASRNFEIYKLEYLSFGTAIKDYISLNLFGSMHDKIQNSILKQCKKFMF